MKKIPKLLSVAMTFVILSTTTIISVNANDDKKYVTLGGEAFGVKLYSDGVMIINLESYFNGEKYVCPAKESGLQEKDIIKSIDNKEIKSNEELQSIITSCDGQKLEIDFERDGKLINTTIEPSKNTVGMYLIGAWVRDSCAGLGTITYYDEDNGYFAALGHGICDTDTNSLIPVESGEIVKAEIIGVTKSTSGKAGSLDGYFTENKLGTLAKNTQLGIFGKISDNIPKQDKIELGNNNDIKIGDAKILATVNGNPPEYYDIKITRLCNFSKNSNENFVIKITDKKLIQSCGGIVQGMSGSPIIQNNKLVGAVTHVFVNQPDEGYGVVIQNMVSICD